MSDPAQLDLGLVPPSAPPLPAPRRRPAFFAGYSRAQLLAGTLILLALVWAMWVTKTLLAPQRDHIVSARLSTIVGEYVQAQARSASPPEQVEAETRRFMGALEGELHRRSKDGQVVMAGEAVLSRNVPDITQSVKKAVYGAGIPFPKEASARTTPTRADTAVTSPGAGGPDRVAPLRSHDPMAQARPRAESDMDKTINSTGALVTSFGGADGAEPR
ncbi:type-F conjugative transfer system protein TrbI [Sphingobium sp. CFD-2]|uniref:type-F conjugative transfer system protein TrbI n=1 Tax=Sphingobium sp. CFD-2 TaxID=2878542 RepID=UPI00214BEA8F|nr:type-F conjugative transfer system protein TrbI [Sphingobium sp. CFD-2]